MTPPFHMCVINKALLQYKHAVSHFLTCMGNPMLKGRHPIGRLSLNMELPIPIPILVFTDNVPVVPMNMCMSQLCVSCNYVFPFPAVHAKFCRIPVKLPIPVKFLN